LKKKRNEKLLLSTTRTMNLKTLNCSAFGLLLVAVLQNFDTSAAFTVAPATSSRSFTNHRFAGTAPASHPRTTTNSVVVVYSSEGEAEGESKEPETSEEKVEAVGNLVENDEWEGLTMELSEVIKLAVVEDIKKNTRDFIGKEAYQVGDITKEIDLRVKSEIASMRGNEEYQLGDLIVVMDNMAKDLTEDLTGKPYEAGDLSTEVDKRVKSAVADFCGNDEYQFGDLSSEIDKRVKNRVADYIGKDDYEFGDVSKEVEKRRREWVKGYLGDDAAKDYEFGDITKKAMANLSGQDDYQFGDVTKKLMGNIFGGKRKLK